MVYTVNMAFEDYREKSSVTVVYTGEGKGKTSASLGLMMRALGASKKVAFIQFIKDWEVSEHKFIEKILPSFSDQLTFYKGGKGFYNAGNLSSDASEDEHKSNARQTYEYALATAISGDYDIVICDEINNAVDDGLLGVEDLKKIIADKNQTTSLCLTGRNFPSELLDSVDIATEMTKLKHHFDDKYLANQGIDY